MTLQELLKAQNLSDEQITAVITAMKENKIYTAGQENLDIRYSKLKTDHESKLTELSEANNLINELKKSTKGNDELQNKISGYESQVVELQNELQKTKLESALKVALLSEKAVDVDYLTFKLKEKGEIELDENEKIKGWDDKLASLKVQFPLQFESANSKKVEEQKLELSEINREFTKNDILKRPYAERVKLRQDNPQAYDEAMKN